MGDFATHLPLDKNIRLRTGEKQMPYKKDSYNFGSTIEVEENMIGRYGAKGEKRTPRKKATPEQIKKQNQYNKEKRERRKIKANFGVSDYWITLTYIKGERPNEGEAVEDLKRFLRKLRKAYKRLGVKLKYIAITEVGIRGGVHHHMLLNRIEDTDLIIAGEWEKGHVNLTKLYEKGNFKDLAEYVAKQPDEENKLKFKRYSCSRNLKTVEPERKELKRWIEEPKAPKGYYIEKETLVEGINPVTGHKYRHYTIVRIREGTRCV